MKEDLTSQEDLMRFGKPIKELLSNPGFSQLSDNKGILTPIKSLTAHDGFQCLSDFKDIFVPAENEHEN